MRHELRGLVRLPRGRLDPVLRGEGREAVLVEITAGICRYQPPSLPSGAIEGGGEQGVGRLVHNLLEFSRERHDGAGTWDMGVCRASPCSGDCFAVTYCTYEELGL